MSNNIQSINTQSLLSLASFESCNCNSNISSSSNSTGFDMVLISLLKAVAKVNSSSASTVINNIISTNSDATNNTTNNSQSLDINNINTIINTSKIETTAKDENTKVRIDNAIAASSKNYGVDENLIRAIIKVESNFNPDCVSSAGAKGLMQLMPENCKALNISDPFNIEQNIDGGTRHIKEYLDKYNGNVEMALMAYNGGPTRMATRGVKSIEDIYKMPKETQNYVPKVMKYYKG